VHVCVCVLRGDSNVRHNTTQHHYYKTHRRQQPTLLSIDKSQINVKKNEEILYSYRI